ncbi:MAG: hypothetical protein JRH01_08715 [Deltaproteobacteria bacterium]|nr:hypothetical protein [Deltaproteobacteria bacterium]MBW2397078.1 hypothetical protein [Deltaproteobacteria bacterium]
MTESQPEAPAKAQLGKRLLPWIITIGCFAFLYSRMIGPAAREGLSVPAYLGGVFSEVSWVSWLALMIPYSLVFFLIDSLVVWRVINWFNARVSYADILPVRASTYILSILNEQLGKGAMAVYLNRREGVPGWKLGSSMLFIMICEVYYLCAWANVGAAMQWDALPELFHWLPVMGLVMLALFAVGYLYFRGVILPASGLRDAHILDSFRQARLRHYLITILFRSPALLAAVFVYSRALALFGVEISSLQMLGYLPVIFFGAAVPGPFRAVAISLWVILFPEHPAQMAAFGLVQHNFFIFFNAAIGLIFLRRANREIFGAASA